MGSSTKSLTLKQEAFCRAYLETGNASEAYRRAYNANRMKPESVNSKAYELLQNGQITVRIEELRSEVAKRNDVTVDRLVTELASIAFANIKKAVRWHGALITEEDNPDGGDVLVIKNIYSNAVELVSSDELDDETAAAIAEVSQTANGVKIKFHDKLAALEKLAKHLGMFVERHEHTGKDGKPIEIRRIERLIVDPKADAI